VGAYLIKYINPNYLQLIVALFLIGNVPQLFKSKKEEAQLEKPYPRYILAIIGFLAGFVSGITGAIGLLFNRFYLKFGLTKEQIVATRAANEVFLHFIKLVIYIALGLYSQMALWLGLAIAAATIVSSFTVKYILPYLSEHLFRKIGYGAMVITLLTGTTDKIIKQDKIAFATIHHKGKDETIVSWRNTDLVLEYTIDGGLEIERPIHSQELPPHLTEKYAALKRNYDTIYIEKVFQFRKEPVYEFYCYKEKQLTKFEL